MNLEFSYGAKTSSVEATDNGLRVAIMNCACVRQREHWQIPFGEYIARGAFHGIESTDYKIAAASIPVTPATLQAQTEALYDQLLTDRPEFSLYRIWHFVPQINEEPEGGLENYRSFCKGRALAFEAHKHEALQNKIPAASAVGTTGDRLTIVYFSGKPPCTHIENPRQTPAYQYPEKYGPKSPSFARATSLNYDGVPTLFISGTASILASESIGRTVESQLATTIENLNVVASQALAQPTGKRRVRVYLRNPEDFKFVSARLEKDYLNDGDEAYYLVADICRKELLVEIEVTIGL